jgi:hypothetical protein
MATQSQVPYLRRAMDWLGNAFDHYFIVFFLLTVVVLSVNELLEFGPHVSQWDPLFISGWITVVIGIRLARKLPAKVDETINRLVSRGSVDMDAARLLVVKQRLESLTGVWSRWGGIIVGILVCIAFYLAFGFNYQFSFTVVATLFGYVVGRFLGRATSYGRLAQFFRNEQVPLKVQPGHLDGAAGLKPIGDLYFFQAMLIAIPAIFLAVWWLLIPFFPYYSGWRVPYAGLLLVALTFEILAFLLPLWSFHQDMQRQKAKLLEEADDFSHRIVTLQAQLIEVKTDQERSALQEQLSLMTERYHVIDKLPTWPVDVKVRTKFTLSNLVLFLPLVGQLLSTVMTEQQKTIWEQLQDIVTKLIKG